MKITRRGARKNHGEHSIELSSPTFGWEKAAQALVVRADRVKNFGGKALHRYEAALSLDEFGALLRTAATAAANDPAAFEKSLGPSLKAIVQLQHTVAGLQTKAM